jgi:hypothetical protein
MGMFEVVRDWRLVKKEKEGLLEALRMTPPGAGVSVKNPGNPVTARAIIEILKENPNGIEVMDFGFEVTLMRKHGMVQSMSADTYQHLKAKHQILSAGSVLELGLDKGAELPAHKFRHGVTDDVVYREEKSEEEK